MATGFPIQGFGNSQALYKQALALHQGGRLAEAEQCYRQLLELQPEFYEALHYYGILLLGNNRASAALENMEKGVRLRPKLAEAWLLHGDILQKLGRDEDALASYSRALSLRPDFLSALGSRADLLLKRLKRVEEALADYDRGVALAPDYAEAWHNRGWALGELGRFDEAIASYERALALKPAMTHAWKNRAQAFLQSDRIADGIGAFAEAAARLYSGMAYPNGVTPSPSQLRHDREQQEYRRSVSENLAQKSGLRLASPAVRSEGPGTNFEEEWRTSKPRIVVIDDFLAPEALVQLRRFCLEEPVWRVAYPGGYLGGFPEHGFVCPLLGQIAEELRQQLPAIFGPHPLNYFWAFKYDSRHSGIAIHADSAAVNVNFWITPDEANLDPQRGGLVIWDVAAPPDWDDDSYNRPDQAGIIRDFLAQHGAKPTTIPYRANRAVIFDSDLFHETDTIRFKDGYADRRVNVTMLYGRRHHAH